MAESIPDSREDSKPLFIWQAREWDILVSGASPPSSDKNDSPGKSTGVGCLAFSGGEGQWTANGGYLGTLPGALHRFYGEGGRGGDLWGVESTHSADTGSDMRLIRGAAPREGPVPLCLPP